ncbi:dihydrodipicolinate synthase family protein [Primorskyibacter flagellatus]|uniref:Dihydrodipicolinate synthetase family protein n=1 Tax=Primorskyibacter flagellatus TaxID=1387277 RepID=A0A1W2EJY6_9RHOB|nr:dihydrodipicolinate synthase family protein [Primorskyibacter flagellatus]SMD09616.1 Dihydrodipicolinate synthetase family protein [Primorskyibacter flagellatus]
MPVHRSTFREVEHIRYVAWPDLAVGIKYAICLRVGISLAAATDLPLIVYEVPGRAGRPLPLGSLERILDLPNVAGIKFTSTDLFKFLMLRRRRHAELFYRRLGDARFLIRTPLSFAH